MFHNSQSQPSSKYIDPQKIYPKRLGTYQNGNALVLQYYNLATDKFKKHVIPLDHSKSAKENLDLIYKNPKHGVLLRKVEPKYVENVLKGESVIGPSMISHQRQSFTETSSQSHQNPTSHYSSSQRPSSSYISHQPSSQPQQSQYTSNYNSSISNKQNYNQQNSVSFIESKPSNVLSQQAKEKIQEVEDYYEEEFEDFEVSQSMGKKNNLLKPQSKKQPIIDLSLNSNPANQSVSMPLQSKYTHAEEQVKEKEEKKEKKSKKSKEGKKSKKKKQQPEQDEFDFDFLDGEGAEKKPAKTKQTSKEKTKSKEKSKDKDKTSKKDKVQEKPKVESKPIKETIVEDDFDFDL